MSVFFLRHPAETDLALFAGGELGPLARWRIERHLTACESCQSAVADFFHLQEDLEVLADLPALDWNALAGNIRVQAAEARAAGTYAAQPSGASPSRWMWGAGVATATLFCGFVLLRQLPTMQLAEQESAAVAMDDYRSTDAVESVKNSAVPAAEDDDLAVLQPAPKPAEPQRQKLELAKKQSAAAPDLDRDRADLPADIAFAVAPEEPLGQALASQRRAPAEEAKEKAREENEAAPAAEFFADRVAAPPPPPAAPAPQIAVAEGAAPVGGRAVAFRARAEARRVGQEQAAQALAAKRDNQPLPPQRGFSFLPSALADPSSSLDVAADGRVSLRAIDSETGALTITDVYAP